MSVKLIALDLDGTLLTSEKKLSKKTYDALEKATSMGIEIVPCTGRFFKAMPDCIRELPFIHYSININGASIYDIKNDKSLSEYLMPKERVIELLDWMEQYDCIYDVYLENWGYIQQNHADKVNEYVFNPFYRDQFRINRTKVDNIRDFIMKKGLDIQKAQLYKEDPSFIKFAIEKSREIFSDLEISSSEKNDIEYTNIEANKGRALIDLCRMLNINQNETMGFGDGGNDISLITSAGLGVAMGNAKEMVKEVASFVTKSNDEDGIAYALEKFIF